MTRRPHRRLHRRLWGLAASLLLILPLASGLVACSALDSSTSPVQEPVPVPRRQKDRPVTPPPPRQAPAATTPVPVSVPAPQPEPAAVSVQPPAAPVSSGAAAGAEAATSLDLLVATLWVQTAEEYRGLARQSYRLAAQRLEAALADPRISALVGDQPGTGSNLPPAVILDIDDTVLDNSPFEARLILDRQPYTKEAWYQWCREEQAEAVPGALAFVRTAEARGVAVFYVTNRDAELEAPTRRNLQKLGFPEEPAAEDRLLSRGEVPDWGSEKESRRRHLAERYRILLLVGDDLGDFVAGARASVEDRQHLAAAHEERWGREWILLPNPMYGSWERALLQAEDPSSNKTPLELKRDALKPRRPAP